jgi:nucleotidyltransferase/DNA polymerase involved in DNA repair
LKENTREPSIILGAVDKLSEDVYRKLEKRRLSFRSVSFIAISTDLKTRTKSHTLDAPAKDLDTIRTEARGLARAFLAEHPFPLRRVGVRVANLVEERGQKMLGEF